MFISEEQKDYVRFQLGSNKYKSVAKNQMLDLVHIFNAVVVPFVEEREQTQIEEILYSSVVGPDDYELGLNFMIETVLKSFPEFERLQVLASIKEDSISISAEFAKRFLRAVFLEIYSEAEIRDFAESEVLEVDEEFDSLLKEENTGDVEN